MVVAIARLNRLSYWYPGSETPSLDGASLTLDGGLALVTGPSGGGKSTLLRVLNGLVPHFHGGRVAGGAQVGGMDVLVSPTRALARAVGFVFQDPELQTVYDIVEREVAFGLENFGVPAAAMREMVDQALSDVGAEHLAKRRTRTLSGGERQRVAIASALVMRPALIALDEPTSQLDPEGAALVVTALSRVVGSGRSVMVSEHRVEPLRPLASAVVAVERGRVDRIDPRAWTPPRAVRAAPKPGPQAAEEAWSLTDVAAGFAADNVLEHVTLAGRRGEVLALSGRNGSGKTTLLRVIAGSLAPRSGRVERRPGRIAYLPQNPIALLHRPTVRSEVDLTLRRAHDPESSDLILGALGLSAVAERYPRDLSTGERQRAALAAVLPGRPELVLLDEPTRGMDEAARRALVGLIERLRQAGASIVLATHDTALQAAVADRVVVVRDGAVEACEAAAR